MQNLAMQVVSYWPKSNSPPKNLLKYSTSSKIIDHKWPLFPDPIKFQATHFIISPFTSLFQFKIHHIVELQALLFCKDISIPAFSPQPQQSDQEVW